MKFREGLWAAFTIPNSKTVEPGNTVLISSASEKDNTVLCAWQLGRFHLNAKLSCIMHQMVVHVTPIDKNNLDRLASGFLSLIGQTFNLLTILIAIECKTQSHQMTQGFDRSVNIAAICFHSLIETRYSRTMLRARLQHRTAGSYRRPCLSPFGQPQYFSQVLGRHLASRANLQDLSLPIQCL